MEKYKRGMMKVVRVRKGPEINNDHHLVEAMIRVNNERNWRLR